MNNQYYTPTIEEFYVGFEYEYEDTPNIWIKTKVKSALTDYDQYSIQQQSISNKTTRIKYLDKEDIESLGFAFKGKAMRSFFEKDCHFYLPDTYSFWCSCLKIQLDEEFRTVKIECYVPSIGEDETLFLGKCKNKSELKKILNQIGYE